MIVGLTGRMASGKGTLAEVLQEKGFVYHSLSDAIRTELSRRGLPETRGNLTDVGNDLRKESGPGALAIRILEECGDGHMHIVDSIRNPAEVDALRASKWDFVLICVEASLPVRYERLVARGRVGDVTSLEQFRDQEERELSSADPSTQQLIATEAKADHIVSNNKDIAAFKADVEELLSGLLGRS